jgi:hypothetical protein
MAGGRAAGGQLGGVTTGEFRRWATQKRAGEGVGVGGTVGAPRKGEAIQRARDGLLLARWAGDRMEAQDGSAGGAREGEKGFRWENLTMRDGSVMEVGDGDGDGDGGGERRGEMGSEREKDETGQWWRRTAVEKLAQG